MQDDAWITSSGDEEEEGRERAAQNEELSADVIMAAGSDGGALPGYFLGVGSSGNGPRIRSISLLPATLSREANTPMIFPGRAADNAISRRVASRRVEAGNA